MKTVIEIVRRLMPNGSDAERGRESPFDGIAALYFDSQEEMQDFVGETVVRILADEHDAQG